MGLTIDRENLALRLDTQYHENYFHQNDLETPAGDGLTIQNPFAKLALIV